jgi:hypothetical protein
LINPIPNFDSIPTQKLIASLLEGEGFVLFDFLESWGPDSFVMALKKQLITLLNPLADILYSLRAHQLPKRVTFTQFGNMSLKFCTTQVLAIPTVVPSMESNAMVINDPSRVNRLLEVFIAFVLI